MTKSTIVTLLGGIFVIVAFTMNFILNGSDEEALINEKTNVHEASAPSNLKVIEKNKTPKARLSLKPKQTPKRESLRPSFDIVTVKPNGEAVMAGNASPNQKVEIFDGKRKIGEVISDKRGQWVFIPPKLSPGSKLITLKMMNKDGIFVTSEEPLALFIPEQGKDIAGQNSNKFSQALAMKLSDDSEGGVEVLQKPIKQTLNQQKIGLVVDAIDYDKTGRLSISGQAKEDSLILLYLNNIYIGKIRSNSGSRWKYSPKKPVGAGMYTLRADQVDIEGKVSARREVVFARSVPLTNIEPGTLVVVEAGNSLWRIARRTYGRGYRYTVIYDANKEQIKDADLIFPGQVFALPEIKKK